MATAEVPKVRQWLNAIKTEKARRLSEGVPYEDRRYNVYAAMTFVILMGCFGLPEWWLTTRVYRASLPYGEIAKFKDAVLVLPVSVSLIPGDESVEKIMREDGVSLELESKVTKEFDRIKVSLEVTQRKPSEVEGPILSSDFSSIQELETDLYMASVSSRGKKKVHSQDIKGDGIEIFILHRSDETRPRMHFGSGSRVFVVGDFVGEMRSHLAAILANVILQGYLRMDELAETVARHMHDETKTMPGITKGNLSTGVLNPKLTLEIHVVDPEPVQCQQRFPVDQIVQDRTIEEFLAAFKDVTEVSVKSQILYNVDFSYEPTRRGKTQPKWYLDPNSLQHIINPIETYLGTDVTTEPVYHMLLYIAPPAVSPLFVPIPDQSEPNGDVATSSPRSAKKYSSAFRPAPYNSFVVSGWGSVTLVNANRTCIDGKALIVDPVSMKATKMALVANLRKFFGLQLPTEFERTPSARLTDWEVQSLRYRAVVEYMFSSIRTLNSLTKLLGEITNIVINDEIGAEISLAVSEMNKVMNTTTGGAGGHWRVHSMLASAMKAFEESEKAFFDPSLLSLLYFPDDQKYAVYIPLFLPIGVPVLGSVLFIWKHLDFLIEPGKISSLLRLSKKKRE